MTSRFAGSLLRTVYRANPQAFHYASLRFASTKKYTEAHEWISVDASTNIGTMGITDYAQNALGDAVFVELPTEGSEVAQGDQIGAVESVKAASDIYAPLSGTIEEVNLQLGDQPGLLNKSPEADGWLCKIKIADAAELDSLLDKVAYDKFVTSSDDH